MVYTPFAYTHDIVIHIRANYRLLCHATPIRIGANGRFCAGTNTDS
jgi:hypothetical protein